MTYLRSQPRTVDGRGFSASRGAPVARRPLTDAERDALWFLAACALLGSGAAILIDLLGD